MPEDIFVAKSRPEDALVGPLHTVTYITADKEGVEQIFCAGYGLESSPWLKPSAIEVVTLNPYFGFAPEHTWEACAFWKGGAHRNVQVRVIHVHQETPLARPSYEGLYTGGATISFPVVDLREHEKIMQGLGVKSTVGVKEMEFASPTGEKYISAEIVYQAPENVFILGVTRPEIFVPVGPIDPETGIGGAAYSARCVANADAINGFLENVMGYEIRRDVEFEVGERSAINLPSGTRERFIQAFAPGASTGYLVLMDHGDATLHSPVEHFGPPQRGIGMWSFVSKDVDEVHNRAIRSGVTILSPPTTMTSPFLGERKTMLLRDPGDFPVEIIQA